MEMVNKKLKINLDILGQDQRISVPEMENIKGQAAQGPEKHVDVGGGASVKTNCFGIFPEEVWLAILDKLAHSKDMLSVLQAFPELDKPFQNKKAYWLFDQVIPHLMTKYLVAKKKINDEFSMYTLDSKELFKLRLVAKRWKYAVDTSLQTHSDRHQPFPTNINQNDASTTVKKTVATLIPQNHFNYQPMHKYHLGASIFHTPEQVDQFLKEMHNFHGNPFPGKSIFVSLKEGSIDDNLLLLLQNVATMLQKFGKHVKVLTLIFGDDFDGHLEMCQFILECLAHVPNVQSITISGEMDVDEDVDNQFFNSPESQELFPRLLHLESFDWEVSTISPDSSWINRMIETYAGSGLRKLCIEHSHLNVNLASRLKNLTELHLLLSFRSEYVASNIEDVLQLFPNNQIRKFCLGDFVHAFGHREIYMNELLDILANFKIETVIFEKFRLKEKPLDGSIALSGDVLSVTSLCLEDSSELTYEFLKRLPNLQYLSIYVDNDTYREFLIGGHPEEDRDSFGYQVREYYSVFDEDYEKVHPQFRIWEKLSKLEMLHASVEVAKMADDSFEVMDVQYLRSYGNKPIFGSHVPKFMENGSPV